MKRILIIIPSLYGGGAEKVAATLSRCLTDKYEVCFIVESRNPSLEYEYCGEVFVCTRESIEEYIYKFKRENEIYCAISFMLRQNILNVRTRFQEKVILSVHTAESERFDSHVGLKSYHFADCIVTCSEGVRKGLIEAKGICDKQIRIIKNFVDKDMGMNSYNSKLPEDVLTFLNGNRYILSAGRLDKVKNYKRLINQFGYFHKKYDENLKLLILGSGSEHDSIQELIKSNDLMGSVLIKPYCNSPFPYFTNASVYINSSNNEGFPNVFLEAMLFGLPIVATNCKFGPGELLDDQFDYSSALEGSKVCKRGILCECSESETSGDTHYMADAIRDVMFDEVIRRRIINGQKEYMSAYSNEKIREEWIDIIEKKYESKSNIELNDARIIDKFDRGLLIIYGAGKYGQFVSKHIHRSDLLCFAVTKSNERDRIDDIPVKCIDELLEYRESATVVISVIDKVASKSIYDLLRKLGFNKIVYPET